MASPTRAGAFLVKETVEILRQPRLIAMLVLGPFLVLLLFGLGFTREVPRFRMVLVSPPGAELGQFVDRFAADLGKLVDYEGLIDDQTEALDMLGRDDVDVVAVLPADAYGSVRRDRRAVIEVFHDTVDPLLAAAIEVAARLAADEINRHVLAAVVSEGQSVTELLDRQVPQVEQALADMDAALDGGDRQRAEAILATLEPTLGAVAGDVSAASLVVSALGASADGGRDACRLESSVDRLLGASSDAVTLEERRQQVADVQRSLATARAELEALRDVRPSVLVRPFRSATEGIGAQLVTALDFYIPSALMLLLQHLAVTFAALSLVRERQTGTLELLSVAPLSAGEALVGKYASYLMLGSGVGVVLTFAAWAFLGVPFAGSPLAYGLVVVLVLLGALGLGFLISLVAHTDTQAVQLTMISLLASFFFTGFFLPLDRFGSTVRRLSGLLPATHGIDMSRDVMLRGRWPAPEALLAAAALALGGFLLSWLFLARRFRNP